MREELQELKLQFDEAAALYRQLAEQCKEEKKRQEAEERARQREASRGFPDYTAPIGNLFGIAFWTSGAPYDSRATGYWAERFKKTKDIIGGGG